MPVRSRPAVPGWKRALLVSMCETAACLGSVHRTHQHVEQKKASKKVRTNRFCRGSAKAANRDSGDKKAVKAPKRAIFTLAVEQIRQKSFVIFILIISRRQQLFLTSSLYSIY